MGGGLGGGLVVWVGEAGGFGGGGRGGRGAGAVVVWWCCDVVGVVVGKVMRRAGRTRTRVWFGVGMTDGVGGGHLGISGTLCRRPGCLVIST